MRGTHAGPGAGGERWLARNAQQRHPQRVRHRTGLRPRRGRGEAVRRVHDGDGHGDGNSTSIASWVRTLTVAARTRRREAGKGRRDGDQAVATRGGGRLQDPGDWGPIGAVADQERLGATGDESELGASEEPGAAGGGTGRIGLRTTGEAGAAGGDSEATARRGGRMRFATGRRGRDGALTDGGHDEHDEEGVEHLRTRSRARAQEREREITLVAGWARVCLCDAANPRRWSVTTRVDNKWVEG